MVFIKYQRIQVVEYTYENGVTEPKFCLLDNGTECIVKLNNNIQGNLILFNEYLCYRLALLLEIEMPISGIGLVDKDTVINDDSVTEKNFGYCFYSTYMHKSTKLVQPIINLMKNKDEFYKIILFDHIIYNSDRNPGNLLVQYYKRNVSLQVIDHSHVFKNQTIWSENCFKIGMDENDYNDDIILERNNFLYQMFYINLKFSMEELLKYKELFISVFTKEKLLKIIEDMPKEWLPPQKDINALIDYLIYRLNHFEDI